VIKLSSRGAELIRVEQFEEPVALAVDAENRRLWVVDREEQSLWRLNFDGEKLDSLFLGGRPEAVAAVIQDGSCWIADSDSALVRRIAADGVTILNTVRGMTQPTALATNPWTGELWVCDRGAGSLYRIATELPVETTISDTSLVRSMHGFQLPVDLSVEPQTGACWLVDRQAATVYRVLADLSDSLAVSGFSDPLAVAASGETGITWVSDGGADGTISKLFYNNIQLQISGLAWPRALAVDFNDGSCWIPETEQNRILRYSDAGELLSTTSGFNYPVAISLNRGF
jgi:DNA-binding beta-propeller fold protein YncE